MNVRVLWTLKMVAAFVLAVAGTALAQPPAAKPLPDADVLTTEGALVKLNALSPGGQWLIVYAVESAPPTERLLEALTKWELGAGLGRVVVVVAQVADAGPMAAKWAERLPAVRWVSDPSGSVGRGAGLRGGPMLIGARDGDVGFILAGVLNDPTMLRDAVRGWIAPQ